MDILTVDTETYYDKDFSLSKMQTDAYVLDPLFEVIGVCVKVNDQDPLWFSGSHKETHHWLHDNFNWTHSAVRCHNTLFDGFILTQRFGIKPKLWMDTLAQGRMVLPYLPSHSLANLAKHFQLQDKGTEVLNALGKRRADFNPVELRAYAEYCKHDTELCYALGEAMDPYTPPLAAKLIDMTVRMFTEPVFVGDVAKMRALYDAEVKRKEELLQLAETNRDIIMSNDKFAEALEKMGVVPPRKISKTTGKETYAFAKSDKDFTDLLEHPDGDVQALVAARLGVKTTIAETRAQSFVQMSERGPLAVYLNFWGAKTTGRYSGGNKVNWQNLPARGPSVGLRDALMAPPGYTVLAGDSSNIELRVVMAVAGQYDVLDKLRNGVDLYCDFASQLFGRPVTKADKAERMLGKVACIAEGELVLTDLGLVPIEQVTTLHRVWDGVDWVHHDGVVYKGVKDVIEYQGLRATPDHLVYLECGRWVPFEEAANKAARIAVTGDGRRAIPLVGDRGPIAARGQGAVSMRLRGSPLGGGGQLEERQVHTLQRMRDSSATRSGGEACSTGEQISGRAGESSGIGARTLLQPGRRKLAALWRAWRRVSLFISARVRGVCAYAAEGISTLGSGPYRQQRALRAWEPALCVTAGEREQPAQHVYGAYGRWSGPCERVAEPVFGASYAPIRQERYDGQTDNRGSAGCGAQQEEELAGDFGAARRTRVYDIVNAGPRNRFTASGLLVHNCLGLQYGAGAERFCDMVRIAARNDSSLKPISMNQAHEIVQLYRSVHHKVAQLWNYCGDVVLPDVANGCSLLPVDVHGWTITQRDGFGRPGEPGVVYHDLKFDGGEWTYQMGKTRARIYGPKVVENLCQHLAMQVVMWQTARINERYPVKLSVHDEAVVVVPDDEVTEAEKYMTECLSLAPKWCRSVLPVACEVGKGPSYGQAK